VNDGNAFADPVHGRIDGEGRLVDADAALLALHQRAGGEPDGPLVIPQLAALGRLAQRLGILISRPVVAANGDRDVDLWVRAQPAEDGVRLEIFGWSERPPRAPAEASEAERESDFLRASADWLWETDHRLRFTAISPVAAAAVGKVPADFVGAQITRLFRLTEDAQGSLPILEALAEQRRFEDQIAELRGSRRNDSYRLAGVPLIDGNGRFAGFRGSATAELGPPRDIPPAPVPDTAPPAFGERLDRALRAPLDHIIRNAEAINARLEGPLTDDYATYAADIASAGRHLLGLVDDLVDLQAVERADFAPEAEDIDLADVARRAAGLLSVRAAEKQVRIDIPDDDEALPATGDFRRALQILTNLLANAVRYSPDGGMIWIRVEQEGDLACVVVADQGKGIAADDLDRIFAKFERVDPYEPGGSGLGLYIARRLARAMGGDITVDSAPGQGARFVLALPARA
jgi:signal transduction histidine kinase